MPALDTAMLRRRDDNIESNDRCPGGHSDRRDLVVRNEDLRMIRQACTRHYDDRMRRATAALSRGVSLLFVMLAVAGSCFAGEAPRPLEMREVEMYRQIAYRILERIVALKDRYPHLASIDNAARTDEARDKLWIAYRYTHGMTWIPNPHYGPRKKNSHRMKSFSAKDGIELNLYFYEGEWTGQAAVRPAHIGAMNVVTFIEGGETTSVGALRRDIGRIVADETTRFNNQHQDEKALPGAEK